MLQRQRGNFFEKDFLGFFLRCFDCEYDFHFFLCVEAREEEVGASSPCHHWTKEEEEDWTQGGRQDPEGYLLLTYLFTLSCVLSSKFEFFVCDFSTFLFYSFHIYSTLLIQIFPLLRQSLLTRNADCGY